MQAGDGTLAELVRETTVEIKNPDGLHLRPAMRFVDLASQFDCEITVGNDQTDVDGKSIMNMSLLAATRGTRLRIRAAGPQAQEALDALRQLVEVEQFGEGAPE
jgi:phosphocarrier protein HPr